MRSALAVLLAGLLTGCVSSYPESNASFRASFESGAHTDASKLAAKQADDPDDPSTLVWLLELGMAQRASGQNAEAVKALDRAEALVNAYDSQPELSLSGEGFSALSNPYVLTYRGRNADRIFASTYLALCHLESGDIDRARVALNRTLFRIEDARRLADRRTAIAREEGEAAAAEDEALRQRLASPEVVAAAQGTRESFGALPTYADAVNPAAAWLHGIFFLHTAEGPSDLERARKSLQLVNAVAPGNAAVRADLALAEAGQARPGPGPGRTLVYVLHENGSAPHWGQESVVLPLLYFNVDTPMVSFALPTLRPVPAVGDSLSISWGAGPGGSTAPLASVDAMMLAEFREEWPSVSTRAVASATIKGLAAYAANRAAREHARRNSDNSGAQFLYLATLMTTNLYAGIAQADTRSWSSLPKELRNLRLEAPKGAQLSLSGACLGTPVGVKLPEAKVVLLTVRTLGPGTPPLIRTAILQP
jgi:hypothetical protein